MKIPKPKQSIQVSGNFTEFEFGIKEEDMGVILETLRSRMYSDPIKSICREIASNSRDANREVKNPAPIEIRIETDIFGEQETAIAFKDQGPGISPDRMADVFINYGSSTKRNTNTLTGGFGFGAKTPFSYTDSFYIITVVDEIKYTYCALIEQGSKGKIFLVSDERSHEHSGTTILIPIKAEDRSAFERGVVETCFMWNPQPNLVNFRYEKYPEITTQEFDRLVKVNFKNYFYGEKDVYLLIDGIPYPLEDSNKYFGYVDSGKVYIRIKTGEIAVSATREAVHYDQSNVDKLTKITQDICTKSNTDLQEKINKCSTYVQATVIANDWRTAFCKGEFIYNGVVVKDNIGVPSEVKINILKPYADSYMRTPVHHFSNLPQDSVVYHIDTYALQKNKNRTLFNLSNTFCILELDSNFKEVLKRFPTAAYGEKKRKVKSIRRVLNFFSDIREKGVVIKSYSEVPNTKSNNPTSTSSDEKTVSVKQVYDNGGSRWSRSRITVSSIKFSIVDGQAVLTNPENYFTINVHKYDDNLVRSDYVTWARYFQSVFNKTCIFTSDRTDKYFESICDYEELLSRLDVENAKLAYIRDRLMHQYKYYYHLKFSDRKIRAALRYYKMIDKKLGTTISKSIPESLYSKVNLTISDAIKKANEILASVETNYPLVGIVTDSYRFRSDTSITAELNSYIKAKESSQ